MAGPALLGQIPRDLAFSMMCTGWNVHKGFSTHMPGARAGFPGTAGE